MAEKPDPVQSLLSELNQGLSDLVMAIESGNQDALKNAELIAAALAASREQQQAPALMRQPIVIEGSKSDWDHVFTYHADGRIKTMHSRRVTKGTES